MTTQRLPGLRRDDGISIDASVLQHRHPGVGRDPRHVSKSYLARITTNPTKLVIPA